METAGNDRISKAAVVVHGRTFNAQNQIASVNGGSGVTYDAAGQMTGNIPIPNFTGTFIYDAWGRVAKVKDQWNETLITLTYDASGSHSAISTTFTGYPSYSSVYSPSGQVLEDDGTGGNLNGGPQISQVTYVWGIQYVNDIVSEDQTHYNFPFQIDRVYMQHDLNFSVTSVIKSDGSLRTGFFYDPYGGRTLYTGSPTQADYNIGFQGGQYDVVMGAYKFGARIYLPSLGVWNRQDPAGAGANGYAAMNDNPVNRVDPFGLATIGPPADQSDPDYQKALDRAKHEAAKWNWDLSDAYGLGLRDEPFHNLDEAMAYIARQDSEWKRRRFGSRADYIVFRIRAQRATDWLGRARSYTRIVDVTVQLDREQSISAFEGLAGGVYPTRPMSKYWKWSTILQTVSDWTFITTWGVRCSRGGKIDWSNSWEDWEDKWVADPGYQRGGYWGNGGFYEGFVGYGPMGNPPSQPFPPSPYPPGSYLPPGPTPPVQVDPPVEVGPDIEIP